MSDWSLKVGGGTERMGRSESVLVDGDESSNEAWEEVGSTRMKEKEVWVESDCNTLPLLLFLSSLLNPLRPMPHCHHHRP